MADTSPENKPHFFRRIWNAYRSFIEKALSNRFVFITQLAGFILTASIVMGFWCLYSTDLQEATPSPLSSSEQAAFDAVVDTIYPEQIISALPYAYRQPDLDISAESAILIDSSNGCIIYEKNADMLIPPASMAKLVAMYVVEQEIATGRISYDDIVPLPPECWAVNLPWDSSFMYLAEGQRVTLDELLQGLSVMSGNDAAYALADYTCGSMDDFIQRMNSEVAALGLTHTHFIEPSGYSEQNMTTARDFIQFSRVYIERYPESLKNYHSLRSFTYPKPENLPADLTPSQIAAGSGNWYIPYEPRTKQNTNPLLGTMEGADGLKTGYIDESGYNLSLTAKRNGTRFISVTMRGKGATSREGNDNRVKDGTELMEYAFNSFTTVFPAAAESVPVVVSGGHEGNEVYLVQARNPSITVPHIGSITAGTPQEAIKLTMTVDVPAFVSAPVQAGESLGTVTYSFEGTVLETVPLVADRNITEAGAVKSMFDRIILR